MPRFPHMTRLTECEWLFLDREGTLVPERADHDWAELKRLELTPGVAAGLGDLDMLGFRFIVVTNQYPIGEGLLSESRYEQLTVTLLEALQAEGINVLKVLHCPHARTLAAIA